MEPHQIPATNIDSGDIEKLLEAGKLKKFDGDVKSAARAFLVAEAAKKP